MGIEGDCCIESTQRVVEVYLYRQKLYIRCYCEDVRGLSRSVPRFVVRGIRRPGTQHNGGNPIAASSEERVRVMAAIHHGYTNPASRNP